MNAKWCVGTLITILALIGLNQERTKASNQQIVLQFIDIEVASETSHDEVLAEITKKLQILGVDAIEIIENDTEKLSFRYYSDIDAVSVKNFLSQEKQLALANGTDSPFNFPKDHQPETYKLLVSDLQQKLDHALSLNGALVLIQKQELSIFSNMVSLQLSNEIISKHNTYVDVAFRINRNNSIAIANATKTIPEVRAGPYYFSNI